MLVVLAGWAVTVITMLGTLQTNATFDPLLVTLQVLSIVAFGGGPVVLVGNAVLAWADRQRWATRLWSVALVLAGAAVLWIAVAFHLVEVSTLY